MRRTIILAGIVACYATDIISVVPRRASYSGSETTIAVQTVYESANGISFHIRPVDPVSEGFLFASWVYGGADVGQNRDSVTVSDSSSPVLTARWISITFEASAEDQCAVSGTAITFTIIVPNEGQYTFTVTDGTDGTATVDADGTVHFNAASVEIPTEGAVSVTVSNGYTEVTVVVPVVIDPVLEFKNEPSEGILEVEE